MHKLPRRNLILREPQTKKSAPIDVPSTFQLFVDPVMVSASNHRKEREDAPLILPAEFLRNPIWGHFIWSNGSVCVSGSRDELWHWSLMTRLHVPRLAGGIQEVCAAFIDGTLNLVTWEVTVISLTNRDGSASYDEELGTNPPSSSLSWHDWWPTEINAWTVPDCGYWT